MDGKTDKIKRILKQDADTCSVQNNAMCFLPGDRRPAETSGTGLLAKLQERIKKHGLLYYTLIDIFAPVFTSHRYKKQLKSLMDQYGTEKIILNIGSGPHYILNRKDTINIDIFAFNEVDIVADASDLPIEDEAVDLIITTGMLEHVGYPDMVVKEMYRVLKTNGNIFCDFPFMQPFHAAPNDYYRWTAIGISKLFSKFKNIKIRIAAGPTSGMLWVVQEWVAILFSCGNKTLHDIIFVLLMIATFPIKLLDIIAILFPNAEKISSGFFITANK